MSLERSLSDCGDRMDCYEIWIHDEFVGLADNCKAVKDNYDPNRDRTHFGAASARYSAIFFISGGLLQHNYSLFANPA